jgi:hypothetical protein
MEARRRVRGRAQSKPVSVVVGAAKVITALRAHQLAMVPAEPVPACWANLTMMIDLGVGGLIVGFVGSLMGRSTCHRLTM